MLAADRALRLKGLITHQDYQVAANTWIHHHAVVAVQAGYLVPASDTPGQIVVGLATEEVDNRNDAAGARVCRVYKGAARIPTTGPHALGQSHVGQKAYVLDDESVVAQAGTTANIAAGEILEIDDGHAWVVLGASAQ